MHHLEAIKGEVLIKFPFDKKKLMVNFILAFEQISLESSSSVSLIDHDTDGHNMLNRLTGNDILRVNLSCETKQKIMIII